MSTALTATTATDRSERLAQLTREQIAREEAALAAIRDAIEKIRDGLTSGNALHGRQEAAARIRRDLNEQRREFRHEIAGLTGLSAGRVTLSTALRQLPPEIREELLVRQRQLQQLANSIEETFRENAAMVLYGLDFVQRFLADLTGGEKSVRYSAAGMCENTTRGSIIEKRG